MVDARILPTKYSLVHCIHYLMQQCSVASHAVYSVHCSTVYCRQCEEQCFGMCLYGGLLFSQLTLCILISGICAPHCFLLLPFYLVGRRSLVLHADASILCPRASSHLLKHNAGKYSTPIDALIFSSILSWLWPCVLQNTRLFPQLHRCVLILAFFRPVSLPLEIYVFSYASSSKVTLYTAE